MNRKGLVTELSQNFGIQTTDTTPLLIQCGVMSGHEYVELPPKKWEDVARTKGVSHVYVASGEAGYYVRISKGPWPGGETA
jgi:hypothetical protein